MMTLVRMCHCIVSGKEMLFNSFFVCGGIEKENTENIDRVKVLVLVCVYFQK